MMPDAGRLVRIVRIATNEDLLYHGCLVGEHF